MNNVAENVFQAVDIIVNKKLEGLQFNRTEQATIINDSNAEKGQYTVKTETVQYDAFSENTQYRNNQEVLVNIPNNDYRGKKMIIGLANEETEISALEVIDPISQMLDITNSLVDSSVSAEMVANNTNLTSILLAEADLNQSYNGFTRLGISAEFQTLLGDFNTVKGQYGLILKIQSLTEDDKPFVSALDFNNLSFYGNSYNIPGFQKQSLVVDISDLRCIEKISLYFYQYKINNQGSFLDLEGNLIPCQDEKGNLFVSNLKVRSPYVCLGYDLTEYNTEELILFTPNSTSYRKGDNTNILTEEGASLPSSLHRQMMLRWISINNHGKAFVYKELPQNVIIRWYRKNILASAPDSYVGYGWEEINNNNLYFPYTLNWDENNQNFYSNYDELKNIENSEYYIIDEENQRIDFSQAYCDQFGEITKVVKLKENVIEDIYKAVIIYENSIIISNNLTFKNQGEVIDQVSVKYSKGLGYKFLDGTDGRYSFYGPDGQILNPLYNKIERKIQLTFNGAELNEAQKIEWNIDYLFSNKNMIIAVNEENANFYQSENNDGEKIPYDSNTTLGDKGILTYKLSSNLNMAQAAQTIIHVDVIFNNIEYSLNIPLSFGRDTATEYSLGLELYRIVKGKFESVSAIMIGDSSDYYVKPIVYNRYGKEIEIENSDKNIKLFIPEKANYEFNNQCVAIGEKIIIDNNYYIKLNLSKDLGKKFNTSCINFSCTINNGTITKTFPIPISRSLDYLMVGLNEILYNSAGYPPVSRVGYKVIDIKSGEIVNGNEGSSCLLANREGNPEIDYLPKLSHFGDNEEYYLNLPALYVDSLNTLISITFIVNDKIIWSQPILFDIEDHSSNLLNNWDGTLSVDKNLNAVMSRALGAGKLEDANDGSKVFSGVILGDVREGSDSSLGKVGLYGYHQGVQAFAFKDDGTAFIGKSGSGRISFDGNKAIIQSGNYEESGNKAIHGMKIDLDDGTIKAASLKLQNKFEITADGNLIIDPQAIIQALGADGHLQIKKDGVYIYGVKDNNNKIPYSKFKDKEIIFSNGSKELAKWTGEEMSLSNLTMFSLGKLILQKEDDNSFSIVQKA